MQAEFVDIPGTSLLRADALLTDVMLDCGYPVQDFEQRADLISVDHPMVAEHYRRAHSIFVASQVSPVSTKELRQAFVSYRALFADLMESGTDPADQPHGNRSSASY